MAATTQPMGWQETPNGLVVPPLAQPQDVWTPEFQAFMSAMQAHLPEVQGWMAKSLASRAPLTQPLDDLGFGSPWQGVRMAQTASGISPETMRLMADRNPVIAAIIATRCNQVAAFCQLPEAKTDVGFRVALRDKERQPSDAEKREMRMLEDMILECGLEEAEDVRPDITMEHAIRAAVRDSLTLDAAVFEIIPGLNRAKYPVVAFQPIDAAQIYLTEPNEYNPRKSTEARIVAVQMQRGEVVAEYAKEDIAYGIRNPSTNQMRMGYGTSELEWLVKIVSCILFGIDYNEKYFTTGSVPPGIISIAGSFDTQMLEAFKREWRAQLQGPGNYWRTPFFATKDGQGVRYEKFRDSNRDMEYHQFLAFLITVACSVYNIHPEEIGMQSWAPQTTALNQPSPLARIESSTDRGLKPLLKLFANQVNKKILWQMYPDRKYVFRWVNIDPTDEERDLKLAQMRLEMGLTLPYQEQAQLDLERHQYSDVPVNPQMFQAWQTEHGQPEEEGSPLPSKGEEPEKPEPAEKSLANVIEVVISDE